MKAFAKAKKEEKAKKDRADAIAARKTDLDAKKAAYDEKCKDTTPEETADCKTAKEAFDTVDKENKEELQLNLEQDALDKKSEFDRAKKELDGVKEKFGKAEEDYKKYKEALEEASADKADATALGLGPEEWEKVNKRYEQAKA